MRESSYTGGWVTLRVWHHPSPVLSTPVLPYLSLLHPLLKTFCAFKCIVFLCKFWIIGELGKGVEIC